MWEGMHGVRIVEGAKLEESGGDHLVQPSAEGEPWFGLSAVTPGLSVADS